MRKLSFRIFAPIPENPKKSVHKSRPLRRRLRALSRRRKKSEQRQKRKSRAQPKARLPKPAARLRRTREHAPEEVGNNLAKTHFLSKEKIAALLEERKPRSSTTPK